MDYILFSRQSTKPIPWLDTLMEFAHRELWVFVGEEVFDLIPL